MPVEGVWRRLSADWAFGALQESKTGRHGAPRGCGEFRRGESKKQKGKSRRPRVPSFATPATKTGRCGHGFHDEMTSLWAGGICCGFGCAFRCEITPLWRTEQRGPKKIALPGLTWGGIRKAHRVRKSKTRFCQPDIPAKKPAAEPAVILGDDSAA